MTLTCIAIDDEPPALDLVTRFIERTSFLKLKNTFDNAVEALRFISESPVDVVFLDIQMPDLSGIELARILNGRNIGQPPSIIFTTAFDQFALEGYKLDVVDYLLKPFGYDDFMRAATKALKLAENKRSSTETTSKEEEFIYLKVEFQTVKIACNQITHIEGLKDYAKIYLKNIDKPILSLITLKALEEKLSKRRFMRIHKSTIIALDKITSVAKNAVYIDNLMLTVSEQHKEEFGRFLVKWR
jgi:two-component system response regulator LytT